MYRIWIHCLVLFVPALLLFKAHFLILSDSRFPRARTLIKFGSTMGIEQYFFGSRLRSDYREIHFICFLTSSFHLPQLCHDSLFLTLLTIPCQNGLARFKHTPSSDPRNLDSHWLLIGLKGNRLQAKQKWILLLCVIYVAYLYEYHGHISEIQTKPSRFSISNDGRYLRSLAKRKKKSWST